MDIIIKGIEMLKTCNQCEMRSKCWGERPFWFDVLMYCPLTDTANRKTEPSNSEIPNNCEHITEDGVTCAKYPACDDCPDNPLNKIKGSKRLLKGKTDCQWK